MKKITVVVADDHPLFLEALGRAIKSRPEFELIGSAADGHSALKEIRELRPMVALIDQGLPALSGEGILTALKDTDVPTRVIVLSADDSGALVYNAVRLGAAGFLTKVAKLADICEAVAAVARGDTVLAPEVQAAMVGVMRSRSDDQPSVLSTRETEVLCLVAEGMSSARIASQLLISESTVKTHLRNVFEKLGTGDRAAAVAEAMRRGILT